jgi:mono/diheme cytochrome c family protein
MSRHACVPVHAVTTMQRSKSRVWVLLLAACAACSSRAPLREWRAEDHGQPSQADPARTPTDVEPEQGGPERAVDALYNVSCASCHGRDGRGQGVSKPPGAQMPDFSAEAFQTQRTDVQLLDAIRNGRGMMPAFGRQVNEQGLSALVGRVRRFGTH